MNLSTCQPQIRKSINSLLSILIIALSSKHIFQAQAYIVALDAGVENECFHERVPIGTKLGFSFEVVDGGFYDVDVEIKDPSNVIMHRDERSSGGKFTIEANMDGSYQFCFNNKKSSFAPKVVIFDIEKAEPGSKAENPTAAADASKTKTGDENETDKAMSMINQLMLSTISARHDVQYLAARDKVHRKISEKTNANMIWWGALEFILLTGVSVGQVFYLRRFFEIRHKA